MQCDLILKNGYLLNPKRGIHQKGDLAINNGKIIPTVEGLTAKRTVDVKGNLIVPGLIDIHTHINYRGGYSSMPADPACLSTGVTAAVDAGSAGISNCPGLLHTLQDNITKTKIMLNVSACGIIMATQFAEPVDPSIWNIGIFDEMFAKYGQDIIGLKLRLSSDVVGEQGLYPLEKTVELAERYGTRVIVHTTNPPDQMGAIADVLRKGDVLTHLYHGDGYTCLENGCISERLWNARKRGVIFDAASGQGNFSLVVARKAIEQGFLPDSISTDLNINNWNNRRVYHLPAVMSKFMALGMSLEDVIDAATEAPAIQWGAEGDLGCLLEGSCADITVLELRDGTPLFEDKYGNTLRGTQLLIPHMTVIDGKVWYQSTEFHPGM